LSTKNEPDSRGLVPGTHVFPATGFGHLKTWMTGTSPVKGIW
jgi:hypothetical protein